MSYIGARMAKPPPSGSLSAQRLFRTLGLLWALLTPVMLSGQVQTYRHFDDRDGLPQSQVTSLMEDQDGFVWAGTAEGAARLGASGFQPFGSNQGLEALDLNDLLQDRTGAVWVAAQEGGVARIQGGRVVNFSEAQGLGISTVYCLAEGASGAIFAGTRLGLFQRKGPRFERVALPGDWSQQPIFAMATDPAGGLWLGSVKNRLARWDGSTLTPAVLPELMAARFRRLQLDASGLLWALSSDALYRQAPGGRWLRDPLPGLKGKPRFRSFQVTPSGELLLAMDTDGLYLRGPSGAARVLTHLDGLPKEGVASVLRDSRGTLWVGTDGAGLLAQSIPGLLGLDRDLDTGVGLGLGTVLTFLEDRPGRMFIGSSTGLYLWEEGRGLVGRWDEDKGLPSFEVWALAKRVDGGVWVATLKGLAAWDGGQILKGPKELENVSLSGLLEYRGRLWVCTFEKGLVELDLHGRFIARYPAPAEVGEPAILHAIPSGDGLLVGTRFGLYTFRNGVYLPALRGTPVGTRSIASLYRGPGGDLWVGTGGDGVLAFPDGEAGRCEAYGEKNAQLHGRVGWVCRIGGRDVVIGHGRGLSILRDGGGVLPITRNLGLLSNETSDSAVLLDHRGRLWIGMAGGLCILEPSALLPDPAMPAPRILDASVGTLSRERSGRLVLPPRPGTLTLRFDTAKPLVAGRPSYEVWVDGTWRTVADNSNLFQIANLGPGTFQLKVRTAGSAGWTESEPLEIQVQAAWYQTAWARTGFVLAGGLLMGLLLQVRLRRVRRRARRLEAMVLARTEELTLRNRSLERLHHQLKHSLQGRIQLMNTVSHDLRSPLTTILLSVDRLEQHGELSKACRTSLKVVAHEAQRLERLLKNLLDSAKAESIADNLAFRLCHPGEILEGLADTLAVKAEARDLEVQLALDPACASSWVLMDAEAMQQVLFNLIENALKFTPAPGTIGIRSRLAPGRWLLEVWDTGRGLEPGQAANLFKPFSQARAEDASQGWGLGLSICRTLVEAHEGTIEAESEPGQGSVFRVTLPLVMPKA